MIETTWSSSYRSCIRSLTLAQAGVMIETHKRIASQRGHGRLTLAQAGVMIETHNQYIELAEESCLTLAQAGVMIETSLRAEL